MRGRDVIRDLKQKIEGTSLVFMIVMVSVIVIVGATMMIVTIGYYKLNLAYAASEELYSRTDRLSQILTAEIEKRVGDVIKDEVNVLNETKDAIDSQSLQAIFDKYKGVIPLSGANDNQKKQDLNDKLMEAVQDIDNGEMVSKALYDIIFKLKVYGDSKSGSVLNSSEDIIAIVNPIMADVSNVFEKKEISIDKTLYSLNAEGQWLNAVYSDPTHPPAYDTYINIQKYYPIQYTVKTENAKVGIQKKLAMQLQLSSAGFGGEGLKAENAIAPKAFSNYLFEKALITAKDVNLNGTGSVTINGDIYAFGTMPNNTDASKIIVSEDKYGGININDSKTVTVTGNVDTRAYLKLKKNNTNFTINNGNLLCDTLFTSTDSQNSNIQIKSDGTTETDPISGETVLKNGHLSTFNDVKIGGLSQNVLIEGSYYGMYEGSQDNLNRSSSIIIDDASSLMNIKGDALIGGVAFMGNVTKGNNPNDPYAYKIGESITIGDNYKIYRNRLFDVMNSFGDTDYNTTNVRQEDFQNWEVDNSDESIMSLFCKYKANGNPDYDNDLVRKILIKQFYYYSYMSGQDSISYYDKINRNSVTLDPNKKFFSPWIINANNKSYWPTTPQPSLPNPNRANFSTFANTIDAGQFGNIISSLKTDSESKLQFIKNYLETNVNNAETASTRQVEYTDDTSVLGTLPSNPYTYTTDPSYYFYISNNDINLGNGSAINGKIGVIYSKGKVILSPTANLTFYGSIIALGGIEINNSGSLTIDNTTKKDDLNTIFSDTNISQMQVIRRFFAPGNFVAADTGSHDISRGGAQSVRIIDKKLLKNH